MGSKIKEKLTVVGIGASAGGLVAINSFFDNLPNDTGMAFIIVQHLSPDFKSLMPELLSKHTQMEIFTASDKQELKPNCIYLNQRNKNLHIKGNKLYLLDKGPKANLNLPIDIFFHTLGEEYKENSVGVIFSGTGSDGSRGIHSIKENGGTLLIQDPKTAQFDGMPNSAIATNFADYILSPKNIAEVLSRFKQKPILITHDGKEAANSPEIFKEILIEIHKTYGIDFTKYKKNTLIRRLEKRMNINNFFKLKDYLTFLRKNKKEVEILRQDFLIGVTRFFRDSDAFESLNKNIIPDIFKNKQSNDTIRVWVAGCSSGEEVYSLAFLLDNYIIENKRKNDFKIFATDIDQRALEIASNGSYPISNCVDSIPQKYLDKYFLRTGDKLQITKRIREKIVFSKHNILSDPPFIRLDIITCRNLLIYLDNYSQKKIFTTFQFALNHFGYLFLGPSESLGEMAKYFKPIDFKWKSFQNISEIKLIPSHHTTSEFQIDEKTYFSSTNSIESNLPFGTVKKGPEQFFNKLLSDKYSPEGIIIDTNFNIIFIVGDAGKRLIVNSGVFNSNLLVLVNSDIATIIRRNIKRVKEKNEEILIKGIVLNNDNNPTTIDLSFSLLSYKDNVEYFFISFQNEKEVDANIVLIENTPVNSYAKKQIQDLDSELTLMKAELQNVVEELETSNEELQSSNEELMASNEELQSTNEELQSVNEELYTVNTELTEKNNELSVMNNDMDNLFNSTDIGTLFLDMNLKIRKFTPSLERQFSLEEDDLGRTITSFASKLNESTRKLLLKDIQKVLAELTPIEKEVNDEQHDVIYLMRISPFITVDKVIEGIIITFVDITSLKKSKDEIELLSSITQFSQNSNTLNGFLKQTADALGGYFKACICGIYLYNNKDETLIFQATSLSKKIIKEMGEFSTCFLPGYEVPTEHNSFGQVINSKKTVIIKDAIIAVKDLTNNKNLEKIVPEIIELTGFTNVIRVPLIYSNELIGVLGVSTTEERSFDFINSIERISYQIAAGIKKVLSVLDLKISQDRFKKIVENTPSPTYISYLSNNEIIFCNNAFSQLVNEPANNIIGTSAIRYYSNQKTLNTFLSNLKQNKEIKNEEIQIIKNDGEPIWLIQTSIVIPFMGENCIFSSLTDISEQKRTELELIKSKQITELVTKELNINYNTLKCITTSVTNYLEAVESETVFGDMLEEILHLTGCEFGFIGKINNLNNKIIIDPIVSIETSENKNSKKTFKKVKQKTKTILKIIHPAVNNAINSKKLFISNDIVESFGNKLIEANISIGSLCCVPLIQNNNVIGILGLINQPTDFKKIIIEKKLELFILTFTQLISDINNKERENVLKNIIISNANELKQIIDTANAPIFGIDSNGLVNEWNKSAEKITGFKKEEIFDNNLLLKFIEPEFISSIQKVFSDALKGKETSNIKLPIISKDGRKLLILFNSTSRRNEKGKIIGVLGVGQDYTDINEYKVNLEQKVIERTIELEDSLKREKELGNLKSSFISMASHEFRTPLTIIKASANSVSKYLPKFSEEKILGKMKDIDDQINNMTIMLEDVLTLGKYDSENTDFKEEYFDLVDFIKKINTEISSSFSNRESIIEKNKSEIYTFGDKKWLKHVVINLLQNAYKYSEKPTLITITVWETELSVNFSIKDNGIGFGKHEIPKLFEPFHRGENSFGFDGTGLGLAIVKRAVELHNGKINVTSKINHGSTFTISLPKKKNNIN